MGKSTSACEVLGCSSGVGRLSKSVKCSTHWFSCCSVVISIWPSLFLIGMFDCWNFSLSFLVSMCRSLRFPCPAASSALLANSSTKLFLSFLTHAFTSLSAAAYSFCAFAFAFLVRLKLRMFFFLFPCLYFLDSVFRYPFLRVHSLLPKDFFARFNPQLITVFPMCLNVYRVIFC